MKQILCELRKEFTILKTYEVKPNFAYLARKYNLDPRTVKKYYEGYDGKPTTRNKSSKLDKFADIIKDKLECDACKISAIHFFLKNEKDYEGSYSNLTYYIRNQFSDILANRKSNGNHVRYETSPGEQMQFDWVEDIEMVNKYGEIFTFNVFSAELTYSRMHYFNYSLHKTREDVFNNLIQCFKFYGGIPESILTDNMSSIVNTKEKKFCSEFKAFSKDVGIIEKKCKVRHPFTKGKVEVRNKFIKWLIPYNNEFKTEDDIIEIIKKINIEVNNRVNSTTHIKPILLYSKEKEYLKPLPANQIFEQYMDLSKPVKVQNSSLIYYKGHQYSVPPKYINKTLKVKEIDNKLYIYDTTNLVVTHEISDKTINYKEEHYLEILKDNMPTNTYEQIEQLAKKNLLLLDQLTNKGKEDKNDLSKN